MKGALIALALIGCGVIGLVAWSEATKETREQYVARCNLEILDAIEQAWAAHRKRPFSSGRSLADPAHFQPLIADLRSIDLDEAGPQVKAVHERFLEFVADAPEFLEEVSEGPPEQESAPGTRLRPANAQWLLRVRNAGIQLEVAQREIRAEMARLRKLFISIAKPRRSWR